MADWKDTLRAQGAPEDVLGDVNKAMAWLANRANTAEAKLKAEQDRPLKFRLNADTGTIMLTGLRQFPVSLYASEWTKVHEAGVVPAIMDYIKANRTAIDTAEAKGKAAKAAATAAA